MNGFRLLLVAAGLAAVPPAPASADLVHEYMGAALQGDLSALAGTLETLDLETAAPSEADLARRFRARFLDRSETLPVPDDPFVAEVVRTYRGYWTRVLLGDGTRDEAESDLLARLAELVGGPGDDVLERLNRKVEAAGYGLISGRTLPHLELMLWARQDTTRYDVRLTDEEREVTVVLVGDFLVKGWAEFATFGKASTGGWATGEALFCLVDDYDLDSERFRVSYLQHETRHFADYERFPALQQVDLEYRAKLTELCFARETLPQLLTLFRHAGRDDPAVPHPYANFAVIRDLGAEMGTALPADPGAADPDAVRKAALALLERSTRALEAAGADTVRGLIVEAAPASR